MKKSAKIISAASAAVVAAAIAPYRFNVDKETGEFEMGGLLWNLKKVPNEEGGADISFQLLPFLKKADEEEEGIEIDITIEPTEETEREEAEAEPEAEQPQCCGCEEPCE